MKMFLKAVAGLVFLFSMAGAGLYWFFPGVLLNGLTHAAKWKGGIETRSIQVDDHLWPYLTAGDPDRETIVLVHGFSSSKEPWIHMMTRFGKDYHVVAPDLPGFAKNRFVAEASYTIADQAARLDRFLSILGVDKVHLFGISMGGYISAWYAAHYPDKLLSLVLMDAAGIQTSETPDYIRHFENTGENLLIPDSSTGFEEMMAIIYHVPPKIPSRIADHIMDVRKKRLETERVMFDGILLSLKDPLEPHLPKISAPTLIIWGDKDRIVDVSAVKVFEAGIPDHQTRIFKNVGHVPFLEAPAQTYRVYEEFLKGLK
ncbi:MAG: alpha/beta hydrolase [Desulfobacterales bacterium]|nr:alpha/beta hydrolase [Desulfobacterales bacterium]